MRARASSLPRAVHQAGDAVAPAHRARRAPALRELREERVPLAHGAAVDAARIAQTMSTTASGSASLYSTMLVRPAKPFRFDQAARDLRRRAAHADDVEHLVAHALGHSRPAPPWRAGSARAGGHPSRGGRERPCTPASSRRTRSARAPSARRLDLLVGAADHGDRLARTTSTRAGRALPIARGPRRGPAGRPPSRSRASGADGRSSRRRPRPRRESCPGPKPARKTRGDPNGFGPGLKNGVIRVCR